MTNSLLIHENWSLASKVFQQSIKGVFEPIILAPGESGSFTVSFEVGNFQNQFMFSVNSSVDPANKMEN